MELCEVLFEAHRHGATIYVSGLLGESAALRAEELVRALPRDILALRIDLRAVDLIDPVAFVRVARSFSRWRDAYGGRVNIEFPARWRRSTASRAPHLQLVGRTNT